MSNTTPPTEASAPNATATGNLGSELTMALSSADSTSAQRLQHLSLVHQARLSGLARTAASLKAQYGASSPQATAAETAVTAATATIARVAIVNQQLTTPAPQVASTGWALQGRVFDAEKKPVSAYSVFLVDAQNAYQSAYGFAYTDDTGYFLLSFAGTPAAPQTKTKDQQTGQSAAETSPQLFVQIANSKRQSIYLSTTAFQPTIGAATYQNFVLPAGEKPIGDPPAAVRKGALPPAKKTS